MFYYQTLNKKVLDRKKFLKNIGIGAVAAPLIGAGLVSCSKNDDGMDDRANNVCGVTKTDVLGPYYVSGTSKIVNLNTQNLPGEKIIVTGKIYGGVNKDKLVPNAMVEVWHADGGGIYHPIGDGKVADYAADKITLRGFVLTDAEGNYTFESIKPGLYPGRPRHFHYKVTANGYKTLVTQIYFTGDARTKDEGIEKCRIIDFKKDSSSVVRGTADIHLETN